MKNLVVALDNVSKFYDDYGSLIKRLSIADGLKLTAEILLFSGFMNALYWGREYLYKFPFLMIDLKIADVGIEGGEGTNFKIIREALSFIPGVEYFTVHGFPGEYSVKECVDAVGEEAEVLLLSSMTHKGSTEFMGEHYFYSMLELGERCGVHGYIVPGNDMGLVLKARNYIGEKKVIYSPGFGRQVTLRGGEKVGMQEQISNWRAAMGEERGGGIIVGSYIMEDDDPEDRITEIKGLLSL